MKTSILVFLIILCANILNAQSFEETKKSAEQGVAKAQYGLGAMYYEGVGILTDKSKAAFWIKKAYENSNGFIKQMAKEYWEENELWKY